MALPDYVRVVTKPNGTTFFYFEKYRRTPRAWPRVRIPADPLSVEFAKRKDQLHQLETSQDAAGEWTWLFVDVTDRRHPLPAPSDCAAFWAAVDKADEIGRKLQAGIRKTFASLIVEFKESAAYTDDISDSTREQYGRCMEMIKEAWGDEPVESLEAPTIQNVLDKSFKDTPAAGRVFRSTLSRIISWGIPRGYCKTNPVDHTERRDSGGTYSPWTVEAFELFFVHARVDMHMAVFSGLFTGQRKVDILKMVRPREGATEMPVRAQKTDILVPVQIHSEYRSVIDSLPVSQTNPQVMLHLRADGQPWTYEGFKTAWGREMEKPELAVMQERRWTFHGLRKNAVCMLLEAGATEDQVGGSMAISGFRTPPAEQKRKV